MFRIYSRRTAMNHDGRANGMESYDKHLYENQQTHNRTIQELSDMKMHGNRAKTT